MSAHDPRVTLQQIEEAANRLQTICAGKTLEQLLADWQATAALERFIEILGEAVNRKAPLARGGRFRAQTIQRGLHQGHRQASFAQRTTIPRSSECLPA